MMIGWLKRHWLQLLAIMMALGALGTFPYAYYQLMNWVVMGAAIMTAWEAYTQKKEWIMWIFIAAAVIFNPLAPIYLRADLWLIADVVVAILFFLSFFFLQKNRK